MPEHCVVFSILIAIITIMHLLSDLASNGRFESILEVTKQLKSFGGFIFLHCSRICSSH